MGKPKTARKKPSGKKHTRRLAGILGKVKVHPMPSPNPPNQLPPKTPPMSPRGYEKDGMTIWEPNPPSKPGAEGIRTKKRKSRKKRRSRTARGSPDETREAKPVENNTSSTTIPPKPKTNSNKPKTLKERGRIRPTIGKSRFK